MYKVGGEVDAFCSKCNLILAHTIHAMVGPAPKKVECNTCHVVHVYRSPDRGAKRTTGTAREKKSPVRSFDEVLRGKNTAAAVRYSPRSTFALDQVIEHPTFGLGWVSDLKDGGKIEVVFKAEVKVLIHGRS